MSIRHLKAIGRYYVVSTGYTADDFIESGQASSNGTYRSDTDWPVEAKVSWFESKYQQQKHPAFAAQIKSKRVFASRSFIDGDSGLSIPTVHAAKAGEAYRVKFLSVTDLSQLPFISAELSMQPTKSINDVADEIWTEHILDADAEAARTEAKRNL